jgi:hypothetical protein
MHDLSFNEIGRTIPFVFRKLSIEICNGLEFDGKDFIFSWGEDDREMFVGKVEMRKLLNWFEEHKMANVQSSKR